MLEFGLHVIKVKSANLRNINDLSEWFIRFDDAHCECNHNFLQNTGKVTKYLRENSGC